MLRACNHHVVAEENFWYRLNDTARRVPSVLIDPEGTANVISTHAISAADLVVIPLQADEGLACFETQLVDHEAFRAMFSFGGTLELLDSRQVSSPEKAVANARAFAAEVLQVLKEQERERTT